MGEFGASPGTGTFPVWEDEPYILLGGEREGGESGKPE